MFLCFYSNRTAASSRLYHQYIIKWIAGYIVCGFVACELAWFFSCRPLSGYWALPVPNGMYGPYPSLHLLSPVLIHRIAVQCATYQHYSIVQAVFNITSDLMMLAVGVPLIMRTKVEIKKYADPSPVCPNH